MSKVLEGDYIPAGEQLPQEEVTSNSERAFHDAISARQHEAFRQQGFPMSGQERMANMEKQMSRSSMLGGAALGGIANVLGL